MTGEDAMPIIPAFLAVFKIWMLYDVSLRFPRCCGNFWFYIVLFPGGDFVYFFAIKIHDPEMRRLYSRLFSRPLSLEQLQITMEHCPSEHNRLVYAQALFDNDRYQEAKEIFEKILKQDPRQKEALLGSGLCDLQLEATDAGINRLQELSKLDLSFRDFRAPLAAAEALRASDRKDQALELLKQVAKRSSQLEHTLTLAEVLIECGQEAVASEVVSKRLNEEQLPTYNIRRSSRATMKRAKELLKTVQDTCSQEAGS